MMNRPNSFDANERAKARQPTMSRPIQVTDEDVREFELALEDYKRGSGRLFPTCSELLEVIKGLGYEKRIWRPVASWAPIMSTNPDSGCPVEGSGEVSGWFSQVETQTV